MAKIKLNPMFAGISGTLGDTVFRTLKNGETIISMRPRKSNAQPSEAQVAQQKRFTQAHDYARAALEDPTLRTLYEERAAKEGKYPYAMARSDYLNGNDLLSR